MKKSDKLERKIYHILGAVFGCISSCYFIFQHLFDEVEGITNNIGTFSTMSIVFGFIMAITSTIFYLRKQLSQ